MTITEEGIYVCDFCGEDTGKFNQETGNHPICERLADLEKIAKNMYERLKVNKERFDEANKCGDKEVPTWILWISTDQEAVEAYAKYTKRKG